MTTYRCILNGGTNDCQVLERPTLDRELVVAAERYVLLRIDGVASQDVQGCFRYMLRYLNDAGEPYDRPAHSPVETPR